MGGCPPILNGHLNWETAAMHRRTGRQRGQTLVIFALSFTVLLGLAGLAVDVARAYDLYAGMQRAAEAGALAGALYMPSYYNLVRPGDVDSAVSRASKEVVMNGFGSVLSPTATACVPGVASQIPD
jgi:Flp pilus assembly protein TadG